MSSKTLSAQNTADTTDAPTVTDRLPAGAERLGIDAAGRIHYWIQHSHEMVVIEPTPDLTARIERIDVSPGADFRGYVKHATEIAGWDSLGYSDEFVGILEGAI